MSVATTTQIPAKPKAIKASAAAAMPSAKETRDERAEASSLSANFSHVRYVASKIFGLLVLVLLGVIVIFPVYYSFAGTLMQQQDIAAYPPAIWPKHGITWSNLVTAAQIIPLFRQYVNSFGSTLIITVAQVLTSTLVAYALVVLKVRGAKIWFTLFLGTMMIPGESVIIPNYLTISSLGLRNTFLALILPYLASGFGIFMMYSFMRQFPMELVEAARIDGASNLRLLWSIVLPLSRPAIASLAIYTFLTHWNGFFWPLLVTETPEMQTIQIGITQLQSPDNFNPGLVMAGAVLAVIPTLLIVILGQRQIVRGLTAGSTK
ncbi:carbohydrate ABC transporter permease [Bifidobacterium amazonense]|uniref:Carbohydrate ABC transporter permease n=1 Tax=Bifidobacterium amazonense TaxID=2809027 RepID=A0ABS9VWR0_9BIFI|nr:carbohydrate ABC transporter permease [Bifidobacterium amazonense]MCH9276554.1 carbohydrate ABC transporter permease [Bifidobacterium amazonense]